MITQQEMTAYYADIAPRLMRFLLANGCPHDKASDITQESFIRIWNKRDELGPDDSVSGLVFRIAQNLRIDEFRRSSREQLVDEYDDSNVPTVTDDNELPQDKEYVRRCIRKAVSDLPEEFRVCYTMLNLGGMSIKEISQQLGISESLVKVRIHRAKEKLRTALEPLRENF